MFDDGLLLDRAIAEAEFKLEDSLAFDQFDPQWDKGETPRRRTLVLWLKELKLRREFEPAMIKSGLRDQDLCVCSG